MIENNADFKLLKQKNLLYSSDNYWFAWRAINNPTTSQIFFNIHIGYASNTNFSSRNCLKIDSAGNVEPNSASLAVRPIMEVEITD